MTELQLLKLLLIGSVAAIVVLGLFLTLAAVAAAMLSSRISRREEGSE